MGWAMRLKLMDPGIRVNLGMDIVMGKAFILTDNKMLNIPKCIFKGT
jgi:hypothetical protein